jgi:ABC-type polysaccharide/polyol phosphate export permease
MILNLYRHRGYIWRTAWAEIRTRYAGAGLGVVWNLLQPLAMILIFTLVFTEIFKRLDYKGVPYPLLLCSALLPWSAFAECINRGTQSFVHNAPYLRKLPIPEQVFIAQTALTTAISLTISYTVLIVVAIALGYYPSWHWLLLPLPMILLIATGFGLGMLLGTLNAFIRDIGQLVPILLQIGFWLYPVCYPPETLPDWAQKALPFNPVYPFMESIRALFLERHLPAPTLWVGMIGWTVAWSIAGYAVLHRLRPELRDVI